MLDVRPLIRLIISLGAMFGVSPSSNSAGRCVPAMACMPRFLFAEALRSTDSAIDPLILFARFCRAGLIGDTRDRADG